MSKDNRIIKIQDMVKGLTYLSGLIGFLSVVRYISPVYSAIFVMLGLLSVYFERTGFFRIPRWSLNTAAMAVILFSFMRLNLKDPVTPAVEGLLILLSIKFLEEKQFRDYMQIYAIAVFLLSGSALLSIDLAFSIYFLILMFIIAVSIVLLTYYSQDPEMELPKTTVIKIVLKSLLIPLISIPTTLFLFITLPRTSHPFFSFLNRAESAKTGFTDKVRLGQVSGIQEDAAAILRVNMDKVDPRHLYWRGIVLDYFDGASWKSLRSEEPEQEIILTGAKVRQTVFLESYGNKYVFALDKPVYIELKEARQAGDLTFGMPKNIEKRLKYEAESILTDVIPQSGIDEERYLQLPQDISPEIKDMVKGLVSGKNTDESAQVIIKFLKDGNFKYSLQKLPISETPLEDFLFKHKYGNCEYFASAMAVSLRIAGIPARLVGGYRGGYYNDTGRYYLIPQKNAHVWVEAYLNGAWMRFDPTPASVEDFVSPRKKSLLFRMRLFGDLVNYYWNALVINYDLEKQFSLFQKITQGLRSPAFNLTLDRDKLVKYFAGAAVIAAILFSVYALLFRRKSDEERLISLFLNRMQKRGYIKNKSQGLEEFAAGIKEEGLKKQAHSFIVEFERYFYKDKKLTKEEIKRLREIISKIDKKP
jgi:transglutaminase-like putative cysteine protease